MDQDYPADRLYGQQLKNRGLSQHGIRDPRLHEYLDDLWDATFTTVEDYHLESVISRLAIGEGVQE